ncbi:MAG: hypothetical protein ACXWM2_05335 [Parachlamydiaceae bacterium]
MSGCAHQATELDKQYHGLAKTLLLDSDDAISKACANPTFKARHLECLRTNGDSDLLPFPEWVQTMKSLEADYRSKESSFRQTGQMPPSYDAYKNIGKSHAFIPEGTTMSYWESSTSSHDYVFLSIRSKVVDGVTMYAISPVTVRNIDLTQVDDHLFEIWKLIESAFPVADAGSPEVVKYFVQRKQALAEAERLKKEQEARQALADYRSQFESAKTKDQLVSFIRKYESNDPDNLIGSAKDKVSRMAKEETEQNRGDTLKAIEAWSARCHGVREELLTAIAIRNGVIPGYYYAAKVEKTAQFVELCNYSSKEAVQKYKELGGTKEIYKPL